MFRLGNKRFLTLRRRPIAPSSQVNAANPISADLGTKVDAYDNMEAFSYEQVPLTHQTRSTHIRLVYICPIDLQNPSALSLQIESIPVDGSTTKYVALSYAWGRGPAADFTVAVTINSRKFLITPSLEEAILHFRRQGQSLPIWIDQICIDQSSVEEKNAQVPLMGKIYSRATQVRIWLGPAADGSDELMDGLAIAGKKCRDCGIEDLLTKERWLEFLKWTAGLDVNDRPPRRQPFKQLAQELLPLIDIQFLKAWFLRSWFHRVWIVQEYCLAKEPIFICGNRSVLADDVKFAWVVWGLIPPEMKTADIQRPSGPYPGGPGLASHEKRVEISKQDEAWLNRLKLLHELQLLDPLTPLGSARVKKQFFDKGKGRGYAFFELLQLFSRGLMRNSTNPRDWIYGLTAIPNDLDKLQIIPDYNLSSEVVIAKFTRSVIENGNLEILRYSQFPKSYGMDFPSWVPDWQQHPQTTFNYEDDKESERHEPRSLFHASADSKVAVTDMGNEMLLAIQGFIVDEIEELGASWIGDMDSKTYHSDVLGYLSSIKLMCKMSAMRNKPIYPTEQRRAEAIWRIPIADITTVADITDHQHNARATHESEVGFRNVHAVEERFQELGFVSPECRDELKQMCADEKKNGAYHYRTAMGTLKNKRPFMTSLGYVGLGPVFAKTGDKVVVFQGATIPFVIRSIEDERHTLIGEAYCDGVMDGEIFNQRKAETIVLA